MSKIYFKYLPINLDVRGYYFPNHQIKVPLLEGKATINDESNYPLKSPNTIYEYGFIDIIDTAVENDIIDLIDTLGVSVGMKKITVDEMRTALDTNGYTHDGNYNYTIQEEYTDIDGTVVPAVILSVI